MKKIRNRTLKYKNYEYPEEILPMFEVNLTNADRKRIHNVYSNYYALNSDRGYEFIIEDLYILAYKNKLTTTQLGKIYNVTPRSVQIWLKELGLNRDLKTAAKLKNKNSDLNLPQYISEGQKTSDKYGIQVLENSKYPDFMIDFLNYLETIKGKSKNTIDGYTIDLTLFFRFMKVYKGLVKDSDLEFEEIEINDLNNDFIRKIKLTDLYRKTKG